MRQRPVVSNLHVHWDHHAVPQCYHAGTQVTPHPAPCPGIVRYQTGYSDIDICQPTSMHNISVSKRTLALESYRIITT